MDFHTMKRKELQSLCKQHKIPANLTNLEMANRLASLLEVVEEKPKEQRLKKSCLKILDDSGEIDEKNSEDKESKRVRFSPMDQTFVFEKTNPRAMRLARRKSMVVAEDEIKDGVKVLEVEDVGALLEKAGESVAVDNQVKSLRTRGRGRKPNVEAQLLPKKKSEESWNSDVVDCEVQPLVDAQREKVTKNTASEAKPVTRRSARSVDIERPDDSAALTEQVENVELPKRKASTRCSSMDSSKDGSGKGIEEVKEQVNGKSRATRTTRQKKGDIGLNETVSAAESAVAVVEKVSTRCLRRNNTSKDTGGKAIEEGNEKVRVARTTRQKKGDIGLNGTVSAAESDAAVVEKASTRCSRRNTSKDAGGKAIEVAKEEGNEKVRAARTTRQRKGDIGLNETASAAESAVVADQCQQRRSTRAAIKRGSLAPGELNAKRSDANVQERGVLMRSKQSRNQGNSGLPGKLNEQASCAANRKLSTAKHVVDLQTDVEAAQLMKSIDSVKISEDEDLLNSVCDAADTQNRLCNESSAKHTDVMQTDVEAAQLVKSIDSVKISEDEDLPYSVGEAADTQNRPCNDSSAKHASDLQTDAEAAELVKSIDSVKISEDEDLLNSVCEAADTQNMLCNDSGAKHTDDMQTDVEAAQLVKSIDSVKISGAEGLLNSVCEAADTQSRLCNDSSAKLAEDLQTDVEADQPLKTIDSMNTSEAKNLLTSVCVAVDIQNRLCNESGAIEDDQDNNQPLHQTTPLTLLWKECELRNAEGRAESNNEISTKKNASMKQSEAAVFSSDEEGIFIELYKSDGETTVGDDEEADTDKEEEHREAEILNGVSSEDAEIVLLPSGGFQSSPLSATSAISRSFPEDSKTKLEYSLPKVDSYVQCDSPLISISSDKFTGISLPASEHGFKDIYHTQNETESKPNNFGEGSPIKSTELEDHTLCGETISCNERVQLMGTSSTVDLTTVKDNEEFESLNAFESWLDTPASAPGSSTVVSDEPLNPEADQYSDHIGPHECENVGHIQEAEGDTPTPLVDERSEGTDTFISDGSDDPTECKISNKQGLEKENDSPLAIHEQTCGIALENVELDSVVISNELEGRQITIILDAQLNDNHEDEAVLANQNLEISEEKAGKNVGYDQEDEGVTPTATVDERPEEIDTFINDRSDDLAECERSHKQGLEEESDEMDSEETYWIASLFQVENAVRDSVVICNEFEGRNITEVSDAQLNGNHEDSTLADQNMEVYEEKDYNDKLPAQQSNLSLEEDAFMDEAGESELQNLSEVEKSEEEETDEEGYENNDKNEAAPNVLEEGSEEKLVLPSSVENASTSDGSAEYGDDRETVEAERNVLEEGSEEKLVLSSSVEDANTSDRSAEYKNNDKKEAAPNVLDEGLEENLVLPSSVEEADTSDGSAEYDDASETVEAISPSEEALCSVEELDSTHIESKEGLANLDRISEQTGEQGSSQILGEIAHTAEDSELHDTDDEENFSLALEPEVDDQKGYKEDQIHNGELSEDSQNVHPCSGVLRGSPLKKAEGLSSTEKVNEIFEGLGAGSFTSDRMDDNAGSEGSQEQGLTRESNLQPSGHLDTHCGDLAEESAHSLVLVHESTDPGDIELTSYEIALFMGDNNFSDKSGALDYWISETSLLTSMIDGSEINEEKTDMEQVSGDEIYKQGFESSEDALFDSVACDKVDAVQCRIFELVTRVIDHVLEDENASADEANKDVFLGFVDEIYSATTDEANEAPVTASFTGMSSIIPDDEYKNADVKEISNEDVFKDSKQQCVIRSAVETNSTAVNMESDDLGVSVKLLTPFPKSSHPDEEMDATRHTCAGEDIHIHENGENKEFELAGQKTDDDYFICESEDLNYTTSEEIREDSDCGGITVLSPLVSISKLKEEAAVPNSHSQGICHVEHEYAGLPEHCRTYEGVSEKVEECKTYEEITPDVQDDDLFKGEHEDTSHHQPVSDTLQEDGVPVTSVQEMKSTVGNPEYWKEELEVQPSVLHPEMSVTMVDDQYKSKNVKAISKEGEITPQLKMKPLKDEIGGAKLDKAEKSSRKQTSATNQKKRSILIHGTPRRPIKTADMKENSTAQFKRDPLANATALKPLARRKALGELSRWRP